MPLMLDAELITKTLGALGTLIVGAVVYQWRELTGRVTALEDKLDEKISRVEDKIDLMSARAEERHTDLTRTVIEALRKS